jgi:hypothetical protein
MTGTISALILTAVSLTLTPSAFAKGPSDPQPTADVWRAYAEHIPIGSTVTVRTTTGERLTALLYVVDDTAITIKPKTRVPEPARRVTFDRIDEITLRRDRVNFAKYVAIGAAAGGAAFLWLLSIAMQD